MIRRGNTKKSVVKDLPTPPIIKKTIKENDEKAAVTSTLSRIRRIPYNELRGKTKANTARTASVTRASYSAGMFSATSSDTFKNTPTTSSAKITNTTAKPVEISPDVSDYYLTDDDDTNTSDDDCGPYNRNTNEYEEIRKSLTMISGFEGTSAYVYTEDYSDYMSDIFASSSESEVEYNYSSENDSSEAERIMTEMINSPVTSTVFSYAGRVNGYLRNFQNTATPVVRARIQDFLRSMDSTIHYSNLAYAVADFKIELSELTGDPLTDFPVFDFEGSTITKRRSGLSDFHIASLPRRSCLEAENYINQPLQKCSICLSEYQIDEELISLECLHRFHSGCLESWLRKSDQCPICRKSVK